VRVVAPLRLEARAVGGTRIGMRARRPLPDGPLALAGVAGAVVGDLAPGDVVVADRVLLAGPAPADPPAGIRWSAGPNVAHWPGGTGELVLPGADALANALRIAGLTVHLGPIGGADELVTGPSRTVWAELGALVVDMESGPLARTGRLAAVVRTVVDTPAHPLVSAGTIPRGTRALRSLHRVAPVLTAWVAGQNHPGGHERQAVPVDITITLPGEVDHL
jgi:4-hydroxy-3-methylbut-2-en-1-yl diphosphate reductase